MNTPDKPTDHPPNLGHYQVRVDGHLDMRWSAWFDGLSLSQQNDGTTIIEGPIVDQAELHGLIQKVRNLGLPLISVIHVEPDAPDVPAIEPR